MWKAIGSFFKETPAREERNGDARLLTMPPAVSIVALNVEEQDRDLLANLASRDRMNVRFTDSCGEALASLNELQAPVAVFDRDLPGTEWRRVVELLSSAPHRPSVILASKVVDNYLWHEVIRWGGYDVLAKPLRSKDLARSLRLALSYWRATAVPLRGAR